MLAAQLYGKLTRSEENLEDLLTSNVFGTFKYLSPELGLIPFLEKALDIDGNTIDSDLSRLSNVRYRFWPFLDEPDCCPAEPDLIIELEHFDGNKTAILIEAKLYSGKSSFADKSPIPKDQLSRECDNLGKWAKKKGMTREFLIFCTADVVPPWDEIRQSMEEFRRKRGRDCNIFWLSWRILPSLLKRIHPTLLGSSEASILQDLEAVLRRQGLFLYEGIPIPDESLVTNLPEWQFELEFEKFYWYRVIETPEYHFTPEIEKFNWRQTVDLKTEYKWGPKC